MRRILLLLGVILLTTSVIAQEEMKQKFLKETKVEAPVFIGNSQDQSVQTDFNKYMTDELSYLADVTFDFIEEGIVVVQFNVNTDGSVDAVRVVNSVSKQLDNAVLKVVENTDNKWMAGKVNGELSDMERTVYVKFDSPGNESLNDLAKDNLNMAIKLIYSVEPIEKDLLIAEDKKERKIERKVNRADQLLTKAGQYKPDDLSILFWQARVCEMQGDEKLKNIILERYVELTEHKAIEDELLNNNQLAVVILK